MPYKPIVFISYSRLDEPENRGAGETRWLSFVRSYLAPAVLRGLFEVFVDRDLLGGDIWNPAIEEASAIGTAPRAISMRSRRSRSRGRCGFFFLT
jgi:hypothetical protein